MRSRLLHVQSRSLRAPLAPTDDSLLSQDQGQIPGTQMCSLPKSLLSSGPLEPALCLPDGRVGAKQEGTIQVSLQSLCF